MTVDRGISLSEIAQKKLEGLLSEKKLSETGGLRVAVEGGGCSGLMYKCDLNTTNTLEDTIYFKDSGHQIFIDPQSMFFLAGLNIGYNDALTGAGFTFTNPMSTGSCGCGESFAF